MYPNLETERLILKPLHESDYDNMYKLFSNPIVVQTMENDIQTDPIAFKKEFIESVSNYNILTIKQKEDDKFIGFIGVHQYINKKKNEIKYSQTWTALFPEYWGRGFCTEATKKLLHFAFLRIKTPLIYANHFQINPVAGKVLKKCGFSYYRTLKMNDKPYDQYRYFRDDYINGNDIDVAKEETAYCYALQPKRKSPYSSENPIRIIDNISYIQQPTGYLCGQSVIAMLANVSVDEVIAVMETDKGTSIDTIDYALDYYGIKHTKTRTRVKEDTVLPDICILSLKLPGYGHWSLYYKGTYYDPEFGILNELPQDTRLNHYWKIIN